MERRLPRALVLCTLIGYFVLRSFTASAADGHTPSPLIITEIAAHESEGLEWVEVYNQGTEPLDLSTWKFLEEGSKHALRLFQGAPLLPPGALAIIADNADALIAHQATSTVIIYDSSWGSLREEGEKIGLIDHDGDIREEFTYPATPGGSVERTIIPDDIPTWIARDENDSFGILYTESEKEENTASPIQDTATTTPADVRINEIMVAPHDDEHEWVELAILTGDQADLEGWKLADGSGIIATLHDAHISSSTPLFVVELSSNRLNNTGDSVTLIHTTGAIIDQMQYSRQEAPLTGETLAFERSSSRYQRTIEPTRGTANRIIEPPQPAPRESSAPTIRASRPLEVAIPILPANNVERAVRIDELYPDPPGPDAAQEFIELFNPSTSGVSLGGWHLADERKHVYTFRPNTFIAGMSRLVLRFDETLLALDNHEDAISLLHPSGVAIHRVSYEDPVAGASYAYDAQTQRWLWTVSPTPGEANTFVTPNRPPAARIETLKKSSVGDQVFFDAHASLDPEGDALQYTWDIAGVTSTAALTHHIFTEPGNYRIALTVTDSYGARATDWEDVRVDPMPPAPNTRTATTTKVAAALSSPPKKMSKKSTPKSSSASTVTGVITAAPGIFGTQISYLTRPDGTGLQLYMYSKQFPSLQLGDHVQVIGEMTQVRDEQRIKISSTNDIRVLSSDPPAQPGFVHISEILKERYAQFLAVRGTITHRQSTTAYIDDGTDEILVDLRAAKLPEGTLPLGSQATIQGIIRPSSKGPVIFVRNQDDISEVTASTSSAIGTPTTTQHTTPWLRWLLAWLSPALILLLLYGIYRHRAAAIPPILPLHIAPVFIPSEREVTELVESHPEMRR